MSSLIVRPEGQMKFTPGTQSSIPLSLNHHMQKLNVRLEVVHTNGANAVFKDEDLFSLVNSIEIVANGNENLKQIPASKLHLNNIIESGMAGLKTVVTTEGADKTSYVTASIPFIMPNMERPHDTILDTTQFTTFDLRVNWGGSETIGTDITVTSAKIDVQSESLMGYRRNAGEPIRYFKETSLVEEITSSTTNKEIKLPVKKLYKTISIASTVNGQRNDLLVKRVIVKSGTTVFIDTSFEMLRAENNRQFKPENNDDLLGIGIIDFTKRGRLSDVLNTLGKYNTLEIVLDVEVQAGGTNRVYVLSDTVAETQVIPYKG